MFSNTGLLGFPGKMPLIPTPDSWLLTPLSRSQVKFPLAAGHSRQFDFGGPKVAWA